MAMMFEYKPGMSLTDPWVISTVRVQSAYQHTKAGAAQLVGAHVLRDAHYIGGVRTTLLETASVNSSLQSQALATTWTNNQVTAANNSGTAPDGTNTATSLVPIAGSRPTINPYTQQTLTITAGEYVAVSVYVKANGYTGLQFMVGDPASQNGVVCNANLATGTVNAATLQSPGTATVGGSFIEPLANGWYRVYMWAKMGGAGTLFGILLAVYPDGTFSGTATYDGVKGVLAWGAQLERWGTTAKGVPTSYMPTTTGTASRDRDVVTTPWPFPVMPVWMYMKFYEIGWSIPILFTAGVGIANVNGAPPRAMMFALGSSQGHYTQWIERLTETSAVQAAAVAYGQSVELLSRFFRDGKASTAIDISVAGGVVQSATQATQGANPIADFSTPTLLNFHFGGTYALQSLKIGADPARVTALALAQAA